MNKEKPCAGGLSWRVIKEFKEFVDDVPQFPIKDVLFDIEDEKFEINFFHNVGVVVNRSIFDRNLRKIAEEEGVRITNEKADLKRLKDDFIVDARGYVKCANPSIAIRCVCKKRNQKMLFVFRGKIIKSGYFWIFPMSKNLVNAGVGGAIKNFNIRPMDAMSWFLKEMKLKASNVSTAPICLDGKIENLVKDNIIKVGESAGLVNPLTAEGIYYAMKSGKIAANCIINDKIYEYEKAIKNNFSKDFKISRLTRMLLLKLPVPIARYIFKSGIKHTKSKIQEESLDLI